ncbi:MAG: hypothetical protein AAB400_02565 [Patescibacteria group bacterium]
MPEDVNFLNLALTPKRDEEKEKKEKKAKRPDGKSAVTVNLATKEIMKEAAKKIEKKSIKTVTISVVAALALAALSYGGVLIYGQLQKRTFETVTSPLPDVEKEISKLESRSKELIAFQSKLVAIKSLFDEHLYWSDVFKKIENATLPEVSYINISIAPNMSISVNGVARDYTTLGRQLMSFTRSKEFISGAEISNASAVLDSEGKISGVNFSMNLVLQKNAAQRISTNR